MRLKLKYVQEISASTICHPLKKSKASITNFSLSYCCDIFYGKRGENCLYNLCFGSRHLLLLATQEAVNSYELFSKCAAQRPRAV
jgi:hypothetical protein